MSLKICQGYPSCKGGMVTEVVEKVNYPKTDKTIKIVGENGMNKHKFLNVCISIVMLVACFAVSPAQYKAAQAEMLRCYVDADASGDNAGTDWTNAYSDLQSALNNFDCREVWVAEGLYKPAPAGDRDISFNLRNRLELFGGFAGTETELEQRDWVNHVTVLSGDIDNNDITDPHGIVTDPTNIRGENSYNVVFNWSGVKWTIVLDGFTITAGTATGDRYPRYYGAGLHNSGGELALRNLTFSGNISNYGGSGIFSIGDISVSNCTFSHNGGSNGEGGAIDNENIGILTVTDSTFTDNLAADGAAIYSDGILTVMNSTFSGNYARYNAGAIFSNGAYNGVEGKTTITGSTFFNNSSGMNFNNSFGGGIYNYTDTITVTNTTFSGNEAKGYGQGGGIFNGYGIVNLGSSTFSANSAVRGGGGVFNLSGTVNLANTIVTASPAGGNCSGSIIDGGGDISYPDSTCPGANLDPLLGALADNGGPTPTHALLPGSPAIDNPDAVTGPSTDQRGLPRPFDGDNNGVPGYDTGAYEWIAPEAMHYPPTISHLPDLIIEENIPSFTVSFKIGDPDTPLPSLELSSETSDPSLIPADHISLAGTEADRLVTISPLPDLTGSATITVTVSDGQLANSASFLVTVNPDNPPGMDPIGDQTAWTNRLLTFSVVAGDPDGDALTFSLDPGVPAGASIDPFTGVFTWTPTVAGYYSVTVRVSDGTLDATQTVQIMVVGRSFIPVLLKPLPGIMGKVTAYGQPAGYVHLYLRFWDGAAWSTRADLYTDANGNYRFTGIPSLLAGQLYYVRYVNEAENDSLISGWWTRNITSYTAGSSVYAGNFDLANIQLSSPDPGAVVGIPVTFSWVMRAAIPSDSYETNLFDPSDPDTYFYTDPLGYVDQYTLTGLPSGFGDGTVYGWYMAVYSPDGGYGESYYYYEITFLRGTLQIIPLSGIQIPRPLIRTQMERTGRP